MSGDSPEAQMEVVAAAQRGDWKKAWLVRIMRRGFHHKTAGNANAEAEGKAVTGKGTNRSKTKRGEEKR